MSRTRIPESYRKMARALKKQGWQITPTRSGHYRWRHPGGDVVITPSTPGDRRGSRNARAQLRKAGLTKEASS